jgi:predicted enzyme related to lactoylglutathione lyase
MINEINYPVLGPIIIGTSDIRRAKKFYVAVFGLIIDSESDHYVSAHAIDGTRIELEEDSENRFPGWADRNIGTYKNCEFHVVDLVSFLQRVVDQEGTIISPATPRPWGDMNAEFSDIDGNIFLVSQKAVYYPQPPEMP